MQIRRKRKLIRSSSDTGRAFERLSFVWGIEAMIRRRRKVGDLMKEDEFLSQFAEEVDKIIEKANKRVLSDACLEEFTPNYPVIIVQLKPLDSVWITTRPPEIVMEAIERDPLFRVISVQYDVIEEDTRKVRERFKLHGEIVGKDGMVVSFRSFKTKVPVKILTKGLELVRVEAERRFIIGGPVWLRENIYMIYNREEELGIVTEMGWEGNLFGAILERSAGGRL